MEYNFKITGHVIRHLRRERGLSQDVLSGLAGIGRTHLSMIENGEKNASIDTLWRIADALNMPLSQLFALIEESHHHQAQ